MQTPALRQLLHGNRLAGVQSSLVDPALYPVQIDGAHLHLERVVFPAASLRVGDPLGCLTSFKACWHFAVGMLTLLTASCCLSLAGSWTATALDALVVGAFVVGERGEDRGAAVLEREGELSRWPLRGRENGAGEPQDL